MVERATGSVPTHWHAATADLFRVSSSGLSGNWNYEDLHSPYKRVLRVLNLFVVCRFASSAVVLCACGAFTGDQA